MNTDDILKGIKEAQNGHERHWIITEILLDSLTPELRKMVWASAIPHWFSSDMLATLQPKLADKVIELYDELQTLPFIEVFLDKGLNVHESTRKLLLQNLWKNNKKEFILLNKRARNHFLGLKNDALGSFGTFQNKLINLGLVNNPSCDLEGIEGSSDNKESNLEFKAACSDSMNVLGQQAFDQTASRFDDFSTTG